MMVTTVSGISKHGRHPEVVRPIAVVIERRVVARG